MAGHRHFSPEQPVVRKDNRKHEKPRLARLLHLAKRGNKGGSYRDRTDDIHGVNVALYQLS